jgi:hypothetical protein
MLRGVLADDEKRDSYGNITKTTQTTTASVFGTAEVHVGANGGVSAYSTGPGSSALGIYRKTCSYSN